MSVLVSGAVHQAKEKPAYLLAFLSVLILFI